MSSTNPSQNHSAQWALAQPGSKILSLTRTELVKKQLGLPYSQEKITKGIADILRPPKEQFAILPAPKNREASEKFHETLKSMESMPPPDIDKIKEPVYDASHEGKVAKSDGVRGEVESSSWGSAAEVSATGNEELLVMMDQEFLDKSLAPHFEGDSLMWMDGYLGSEDDAQVFRFLYGKDPPENL